MQLSDDDLTTQLSCTPLQVLRQACCAARKEAAHTVQHSALCAAQVSYAPLPVSATCRLAKSAAT